MLFLKNVKSFLPQCSTIAGNFNRLQAPQQQTKRIWGYVAIAFNRVDAERLKLVGADRMCAEWVLKNGGGVRLLELPSKLLTDYNSLPPISQKFKLKVVDGSNASIMKIGFDHFKNCNHIDTVILHNCKHLEEDGLDGLVHLKNTLQNLEISGCYNISDEGLKALENLTKLRTLKLFDMRYVKNLQATVETLQNLLPQCQIKIEE